LSAAASHVPENKIMIAVAIVAKNFAVILIPQNGEKRKVGVG